MTQYTALSITTHQGDKEINFLPFEMDSTQPSLIHAYRLGKLRRAGWAFTPELAEGSPRTAEKLTLFSVRPEHVEGFERISIK